MCKQVYATGNELGEIRDLSDELMLLNDSIAKLKLEKEALERKMVLMIGHHHEGQITYEVLDRSITVKTNFNYKIDKEAFEDVKHLVPKDLVRVEKKYTPIKKHIREVEHGGDKDLLHIISKFITKSEAKPSVSVSARA